MLARLFALIACCAFVAFNCGLKRFFPQRSDWLSIYLHGKLGLAGCSGSKAGFQVFSCALGCLDGFSFVRLSVFKARQFVGLAPFRGPLWGLGLFQRVVLRLFCAWGRGVGRAFG